MARKLQDYPGVSLTIENFGGKIDFAKVFGRKSRVHIEVGSGKGTFLLQYGRANRQVDLLGIEWANKYFRHCVDRIGRWGVENVRVIRAEAASFIGEYIGDETVECFHVYFPDPWPKKRHHKRRFICHANAGQMVRCLRGSGSIRVATDHGGYFEQITEVLRDGRYGLEEIDFVRPAGAESENGEYVGTNFERKYLREDREIYTLAVRKADRV